MGFCEKKTIINILIVAAALTINACSTVRDTTDWLPGIDSNAQVKAEEQKEVLAARAIERELYEDKIAFAPISRSASELDAKISVKIGQEYTTANDIERENIGIEVNTGVVTLTGNVDSNESAVSAISIAKSTAGVSRVISKLVIVNVREQGQVELPVSGQAAKNK